MKQYLALLGQFIKHKSVSTDAKFASDIARIVSWLQKLFKANGFKVKSYPGYGNPIIIAELLHDKSLETVLIYGHYDVQPATAEGWFADPFSLLIGEERVYARGVVDNKGQILAHIYNAIELKKQGKLAYNLKFLIEGDEETGSSELKDFIKQHKKELACNFVLLSDGELFQGSPVIELGYRGGANLTLTITTSHTDLHSGIFGGVAPNSAQILTTILAGIYKDGTVQLPGFYDDVEEIPAAVLKQNSQIPFALDEYKRVSGTRALLTEPGYDFHSQIGLRPAIIITGIETGYNGIGYRNAIPAQARAKINFRLVKRQNPGKIMELFRKYVERMIPDYADFQIDVADTFEGVKLNVNNKYIKKCIKVQKQAYQIEPIHKYIGGGLPVVTYFDEIMKVPVVSAPLANEDCNMHAVNENFEIASLQKGLEFSRIFLS